MMVTTLDEDGSMQPGRMGGSLSSRLLKKKNPDGTDATDTPDAAPVDPVADQKAQYDKSLADTKASYDKQAQDAQAASDSAFAASQAKIDASRAAAEEQAKNKQTYSDNTARDLTTSGQAIVVAGGSANDAQAQDSEVKRKRMGGGISSQLGINV